ncbi:protein SIX6OS1 [Sinocyclocheilus rhinocerous]|uniref:protein SIX6OS1 n=1 Tax=Sinocyclocheilus rhinocerous TaxID=307959 RepID=UPI0007B9405F|nr:PREDICTED: protein SIX6OS1 [Sinocyclocheilus rhinocerous]
MEEQTVNQLDNLLLQLGIETRELAQKKDDLKQQIQICESSIQEKKDYSGTTHKIISKLNEEIQHKQNTLRFIKDNSKNLQRTGHLLLQYEKTLEAELETRQDSYNQDMKIFQERMESYRNVFQQYKDRYCQNSLAQKLLKIQAEKEEIERRIRATEEQILEKERELMAALGNSPVFKYLRESTSLRPITVGSVSNSPSSSPGRQEISDTKSPAFVFSMNSGPSTPAFSKLGCDFAAEEASPFTFTRSYFSDKKSPGSAPKFSGFLFDEAESRQEEFSFSFGTESPRQNSSTQDTAGSADSFPFSFSFGKM